MNIVLADPPQKEHDYNLTYPSLALTYLIGYARERFDPEKQAFFYVEGHCDLKEHIRQLEDIKVDVYGITVTVLTTELVYRTVRAVKERFPDIKIICGGPHATAMPEHVLSNCPADVCLLGEGEKTFVELIEHYSKRSSPIDSIDGIAFRRSGGDVTRTAKRGLIEDLDSISMPAWDLVKDFNAYPGMHYCKASPQSYVLCSRGCPFDCNFCSNPVWKENKPWIRLRDPGSIAKEVQWLYELGVREIYLGADEFNVKIDWAEEVCDRIAALGHKEDLFFHIDARADNMTLSLAKKLAGINMWLAHLGIESGNQRTLDGIGKNVRIEQILEACRILRDVGVKVFGYLMLFHAWEDSDGRLCWESAEDVNNTLDFLKKLFREGLIDYASWQVATPHPGSRLWETAIKHDLLPSTDPFTGIRTMAMRLPGVGEKEIADAVRRGVMIKTLYMIKSGNINLREVWRRGSMSLKNIMGIGTSSKA